MVETKAELELDGLSDFHLSEGQKHDWKHFFNFFKGDM